MRKKSKGKIEVDDTFSEKHTMKKELSEPYLFKSSVVTHDLAMSMSEFVHSKARDELPKTKRDFCTSTEVSFPVGYDEDDSMALELLAGNLKNSAVTIIDFQLKTSFFGMRKDLPTRM